MEADLQRYYRVDLRDLWRGGLTLRRLAVLLNGLPEDSLWATALRRSRPAGQPATGDLDSVRWGTTHELLAAVIDATNTVAWTVRAVNSKGKIPPPKPFTRPGTTKKRTGMSQATRERIAGWITASRLEAAHAHAERTADGH